MVKQVQDIVLKIESLPSIEQELVARYLNVHFEEVLDEARWQHLVASSPATLDRLTAEVDDAIERGDFAPLETDKL